MMQQNDLTQLAGVSLAELLKPLRQESLSFEYNNHFKSIENFVKQLRQLEFLYAHVYDDILSMEKRLIDCNNTISVYPNDRKI